MSAPTFLIVASDEDLGGDFRAVVAEGSDLARTVAEAIAMGYETGRIFNQYNGASADLAQWIEDNGARLRALEIETEDEGDE